MSRDREWKVTSLELSKHIDVEHKRLGLSVESEWVWIEEERGIRLATFQGFLQQSVINPKLYPAYDTAELGEMLPYDYFTIRNVNRWTCLNWRGSRQREKGIMEWTEAESRGGKYLYLLKNGHIKGAT